MSFKTEYINYSGYNIQFVNAPIQLPDLEPSTTIDNYTLKYKVTSSGSGNYSSQIITNTLLTTTQNSYNKPLYELKSAVNEYSVKFYINVDSGTYPYSLRMGVFKNNVFLGHVASNAFSNIEPAYVYMQIIDNYICIRCNFKSGSRYFNNGLCVRLEDIVHFLENIASSTFSNEYGGASKEDGYRKPTFDNSSDFIGIPSKPNIGVSTAGFINVYSIDNNALVNLGSEIFPKYEVPPPLLVPDDLTSALVNGLNEQVKALGYIMDTIANKNIVDYVIDCHCIPITPSYGESENVKIGGRTFKPQGKKVTSDYIDFDCGSLSIEEYYNNFIDYVGTRAKLYLPFIGFVPLQAEYFQNGTLSIKYRFNVIDGSFMCFVVSSSSKSELTNSVIASYGGNACIHIPLTGVNYSNMISSVLNGTTATVANISSGNIIGAVNSAMNTLAVKPDMQSSNGYNATSAYLGIRFPYLVIEREVSNFSEYYTSENGLPCNITKSINELSGYIEMDNIHMETLTCTDTEKEMIEELLKSGIIV